MAHDTHHCFFLFRRPSAAAQVLRTLLPVKGLLKMAGVALLFLAEPAFAASGYLKPEVNAKTLKRAEGYFRDGVELYQRVKHRAALRKFLAAERACPELFSAGYHAAISLRKMGNEDAAVTQLKKLNTRFPENIIAHNDLGVIFASKNQEESDRLARVEFEAAVRNGENLLRGKEKKIPQVRVDLAMAYANMGALDLKNSKLTDAEKSFRKAVERYPLAFFGHFGLGNVLFGMKRFDEAKKAYRKAEQIEPNNVGVHIALARCYLSAADKNPRFAIAELKKVPRGPRDSPPPEAFDLFGDAYALLGNTEKAIANYTKYLTLPEHNPQTLYKLGALCYNEGNRKEAKKYLGAFVAEAPDDQRELLSTAYKLLGDISSEQEDYEKAIASYLQGSKLRQAYLSCYYGLADSHFHLQQYQKAREYLLLVLKDLPRIGSAEQNKLREKSFALLKRIPSQ